MVCEAPCRKENAHLHIWCLDLFFPVLIYSQLNPLQWGGGNPSCSDWISYDTYSLEYYKLFIYVCLLSYVIM